MPNYLLNSPSSIITFGTQVSIMTPNNMFIVATNDGQLRLEALKGDQTLTSINLPNNSKFTLIDPLHQSNFSKPLLFNDKIVTPYPLFCNLFAYSYTILYPPIGVLENPGKTKQTFITLTFINIASPS